MLVTNKLFHFSFAAFALMGMLVRVSAAVNNERIEDRHAVLVDRFEPSNFKANRDLQGQLQGAVMNMAKKRRRRRRRRRRKRKNRSTAPSAMPSEII